MGDPKQARDTFLYQSFNLDQIGQLLGVAKATVRKYVREGKLKAFFVGNGARVAGRDYIDFQERMKKQHGADSYRRTPPHLKGQHRFNPLATDIPK